MDYFKGRGAQVNTKNPYAETAYVTDFIEGLDEPLQKKPDTELFYESPKKIVNKVDSPDLPSMHSLNPYQGCEHGCIYCYARNSHQYWGFSAGLDFESKIVVKKNAPLLLEKLFLKKTWRPTPIALSGNTDCYQPIEKKLKITRNLLKVFSKYGNPVGIISKNSLIIRDIDILQELAKENLVHVHISITTLDEKLRAKMEPRTASSRKRLEVIERLSEKGIPCGVMIAPIIPGINNQEIPAIMKSACDAGALGAGYTIVRLNGSIGDLFRDWLDKNFPDRAEKVWHQIAGMHGGQVSDSKWGRRVTGEGEIASSIHQLFRVCRNKYMQDKHMPPYDLSRFRVNGNLSLF